MVVGGGWMGGWVDGGAVVVGGGWMGVGAGPERWGAVTAAEKPS